jgi:ectoine hydroxylase-related dioxygenase (phytanoyl-CoA dioxygenase family)
MKVDPDTIRSYERDGFACLRRLLDPQQVRDVLRAYDDFVIEHASKLGGRDINYADPERTVINSIHKLNLPGTFFTQLLESGRMRDVAKAFLGEDAVGMASEMFAKPASSGLPSPIHQDNFYWCVTPARALTMWISLDRAASDNGGLSYVRGSHKEGTVDHEPSFAPGSSQTVRERARYLETMESVCIELEPGDALVHHCDTMHFSNPNRSDRSRRGLTLQYRGATTTFDLAKREHYTRELEKQVKARHSTVGGPRTPEV